MGLSKIRGLAVLMNVLNHMLQSYWENWGMMQEQKIMINFKLYLKCVLDSSALK